MLALATGVYLWFFYFTDRRVPRVFLNLFLRIRRAFAQCPSTDKSCTSKNMRKTNEKTLIHYRVPISAEGLSGRYWIRTNDFHDVNVAL